MITTALYLLAGAMCAAMTYELDGSAGVRRPFPIGLSLISVAIWPVLALFFVVIAIDRHRKRDTYAEDEEW